MATQKTQRLTRLDQLDAVLAKEEAVSTPLRLREGDEADIRRAMSSHFRRAGAGGEDIGGEAEFEAVEQFSVYRVELNSLYERREVARRVKPHAGGDLALPRVTEANIDAWVYDNQPPDAFAESKDEVRINESQEVSQCGGCQGRKESDCTVCKASGAVACPRCNGTGREQCPRCGGTNVVREKVNEIERKANCNCSFTRGLFERDGKVYSCPKCNNIGYTVSYEPVYATRPCGACPHEGQITCQGCRGKRKVRCEPPHGRCGGTGKLACQKCQGSGTQASYLAVVRSFTPAVAAVVVGDGVPKQGVKHMSDAGQFKPLAEIDTTEAREKLVPGRGTAGLKRAIAQEFEASAAKKPKDGRIARQRLVVGVNRVLKVTYSYEGKSYVLWLMGEEMAVLAPESPLTDTLREKVQEAVGLWEGGQERKAALALREVLDMAEKDADCGAAYEEVRDGIPRKLQQQGKDATTLARWAKKNPFTAVKLAVLAGWLLLMASPFAIGFVVWLFSSSGRPDPAARREREQRLAEDEKRREAERAKEVSVRFKDTSHFLEAGKSDTLRVAVRKKAFGEPLDRDLVLKLEAPSNLTLPASVKVEKGQLEVDVPVTAGKQTGKFRVKVVPEGLKNTETFSDTCTVTVTEPLGQPPGAVDVFASLTTKLGDLTNWVWSPDAADGWKRIPGGISGSTGHHAGFKEPLPADFELSFDLKIRSGKIVRIMLKDPKLAIQFACVAAPDGRLSVVPDLPGLSNLESRPVPHGDKSVRVRLVLSGDVFECWADGKRMATATRKYRGPAGLALSCGDPKNPAEAEFTNFRISAP